MGKNKKKSSPLLREVEGEIENLLSTLSLRLILEKLDKDQRAHFLGLLEKDKVNEAWQHAQRTVPGLDEKIRKEFETKMRKVYE